VKLPRDLSGERLVKILEKLGYIVVRSSGSHVRMAIQHPSPHAVTIPLHKVLKAGTLNAILAEVSRHLNIDRESILRN